MENGLGPAHNVKRMISGERLAFDELSSYSEPQGYRENANFLCTSLFGQNKTLIWAITK